MRVKFWGTLAIILGISVFINSASAAIYDLTSTSDSTVTVAGTFSDMMGTSDSDANSSLFDVIDYKVGVDTSSQEVWIEHLELQYNGTMQFDFPSFGQTVKVRNIDMQMGPTGKVKYDYDSQKGYYFEICEDTNITTTSQVDGGSGWEDETNNISAKIVDSRIFFDGTGNVKAVWTHFVGGWWDYDNGAWQTWSVQGLVVPEPTSMGLMLFSIFAALIRRK